MKKYILQSRIVNEWDNDEHTCQSWIKEEDIEEVKSLIARLREKTNDRFKGEEWPYHDYNVVWGDEKLVAEFGFTEEEHQRFNDYLNHQSEYYVRKILEIKLIVITEEIILY